MTGTRWLSLRESKEATALSTLCEARLRCAVRLAPSTGKIEQERP